MQRYQLFIGNEWLETQSNTWFETLDPSRERRVGLYSGRYPGGTSVLRGAVFGRIAGAQAATTAATLKPPALMSVAR